MASDQEKIKDVIKQRDFAALMGLSAHPRYWQESPEILAGILSGCGTPGWKGKLVPDTAWGMPLTPACNIHDFDYIVGETQQYKLVGDNRFLQNMDLTADWFGGALKYPRKIRIRTYYWAVRLFGNEAYWEGK